MTGLRALAALVLLCAASGALAHASKDGTSPRDGAALQVAPEEISMTWSAPMRVTFVRLIDEGGTEQPLERGAGLEPVRVFTATPQALAPGRYTVEWRGLAEDGHAMQGSFSFDVID